MRKWRGTRIKIIIITLMSGMQTSDGGCISGTREKRPLYMLWRRVMLCTVEIRDFQGDHALHFLIEKPYHHYAKFLLLSV